MKTALSSKSLINSPTIGLDQKQCIRCEIIASIDYFEPRRNVCKRCRQSGKRKKISESPYRFLSYLYTNLKNKRAKRYDFDITRDDLYKIYDKQNGLCAYTGMPLTFIKDGTGNHHTNISIDRFDNDLGYVKENIRLVCHVINMMKYTLSLEEVLYWCKIMAENDNNIRG